MAALGADARGLGRGRVPRAPAPRHYRRAVQARGAPTGSRRRPRLPGCGRLRCAPSPGAGEWSPVHCLPGPAMPGAAQGLPGGRKGAAEPAAGSFSLGAALARAGDVVPDT